MKRRNLISILMSLIIVTAFVACDDDASGEMKSTGNSKIGVTDATVDAENVTGVYMSVNEVRAKGNGSSKTVATFDSPKTFNIMNYTEGEVYAMAEGELEAGSYNQIEFVLEKGTQTSGKAYNYVEFKDGSTQALEIEGNSSYTVDGTFEIAANNTTSLVADIDLRKAVVKESDNSFKLRSTARLVNEAETGTINGTMDASSQDRVVVYAYAKGTYESSEADAPAEGRARFENSINSAVVSNGSFKLAFMEEGEYDLVAVAYEKNESSGGFEFKSATKAEMSLNGTIQDLITVEANTTINVLVQASFE